jgi:hypothetical protein
MTMLFSSSRRTVFTPCLSFLRISPFTKNILFGRDNFFVNTTHKNAKLVAVQFSIFKIKKTNRFLIKFSTKWFFFKFWKNVIASFKKIHSADLLTDLTKDQLLSRIYFFWKCRWSYSTGYWSVMHIDMKTGGFFFQKIRNLVFSSP